MAADLIPTTNLDGAGDSPSQARGDLLAAVQRLNSLYNVEDQLATLQLGQQAGVVAYLTRALLDADLAHGANTPALVTNDADPDNNTYYLKVGASGSGSWTKSAWPMQVMTIVDRIVGEASSLAMEDALFAAGYRFVIRTDLISSYTTTTTVAPTTTTAGPTTTTSTTTTTTGAPNNNPAATIAMIIS